MGTTLRSTRECNLDQLRPEMSEAIRAHMKFYKMGEIEPSILICCETTSKPQKGLFATVPETTMGMVLTTDWLIWTSEKHNERPGVASGRLRSIDVQDFEETAMFRVIPDAGLNITGQYSDVTKQGINFIGLGPEPAAQKFRQMLHSAVRKAEGG